MFGKPTYRIGCSYVRGGAMRQSEARGDQPQGVRCVKGRDRAV